MQSLNLNPLIEYLQNKIADLQAIYLFGSYAVGDFTEQSDIDIAVLSKSRLSAELKSALILNLYQLMDKDIDLVELRYVDVIFQEEILSTAKRIYTKNWEECEVYEDYVFCAALDFRNFRAAHVREIIARGSVYG